MIERKIINSSAECQAEPSSTMARLAWNNHRLSANSGAPSQIRRGLERSCHFGQNQGPEPCFFNKVKAPGAQLWGCSKRMGSAEAGTAQGSETLLQLSPFPSSGFLFQEYPQLFGSEIYRVANCPNLA